MSYFFECFYNQIIYAVTTFLIFLICRYFEKNFLAPSQVLEKLLQSKRTIQLHFSYKP